MACPGGTLATIVTAGGNCLASAAGHAVGDAASSAANSVFSSFANSFASAATSAAGWLWGQLDAATSVDVTSKSVQSDLVATGAIALLIAFALFLIQVIASAIRQDLAGLGRAARGLGVAFIGSAFAIAATQVLLGAVDALSNSVVQYALGTDLTGVGKKLLAADALTALSNPAGQILMALVVLVAVVIIWVALMLRKMLIIVAAVFAPVAFSGSASDISRSWVKRWIEFTVALVFSKLILVIMFMIGLSVLDGANHTTGAGGAVGHAGQGITNLAIGALVLLLAGFAPWMAIKMVHFAGDSFHAVHAQAGAATAGAQQVAAAPRKVAALSSTVTAARAGGSTSSATARSATQQKPPTSAAGAAGRTEADAGPATASAAGGANAARSGANAAASRAQDANGPAERAGGSPSRQPKSV